MIDTFPDTWVEVKLGEIAEILMGQSPPGSSYNNDEIGFPLIAGAGDLGEINPRPNKWTNAPTKVCEVGDLIYCIRATIGEMNWADRQYCLGRGVAAIRINKGLAEPEFIYFWLYALKDYIINQGTGSTFLQIRKNDIENVIVPLPTLLEQRHIVNILNQATSINQLKGKYSDALNNLFISLFESLFTSDHIVDNLPLGQFSETKYGTSKKASSDPNDGLPVLRIPNVVSGRLSLNDMKYVELSPQETSNLLLKKNDVLIVRSNGNPNYVGRAVAYLDDGVERTYASYLIRIQADPDIVSGQYLADFLNSSYGRVQIDQLTRMSAGQSNINATSLGQIEVPIPRGDQHTKYLQIRKAILSLEKVSQATFGLSNDLLQSIATRAFTGNLTKLWRQLNIESLIDTAVQRDVVLGVRGEKPTIGDYEAGRVTQAEREEIERMLSESMKPLLENMAQNYALVDESMQAWQKQFAEQIAQIVKPIQIPMPEIQPIFTAAISDSLVRYQEQIASIATMSRRVVESMATSMQPITLQFSQLLESIASQIDAYPPRDHPRYDVASQLSRQQKFLFWVCDHQDMHFTVESIQEETELSTDVVRRALDLFASLGLIIPVSIPAQSSAGPIYTSAFRRANTEDEVRLVDLELLEVGQP